MPEGKGNVPESQISTTMKKLQIIFFAILLVGVHGSKKVYKMDIDERGTRFNESVEIDKEKKTVVYKVPAHNDISKSETLLDYESGVIATRISASKECYIQFTLKQESSLEQINKNLKLREHVSRRNVTIPVKTVSTVIIKQRLISRRELSRKVSSFCAGRKLYLVKERSFEDVFGSDIQYEDKGLGKRSTITYTFYVVGNSVSTIQKIVAGCKRLREYESIINTCKGKVNFGCRNKEAHCRYNAYCQPSGDAITKWDDSGKPYFAVTCEEEHKFTSQWCCDVLCDNKK